MSVGFPIRNLKITLVDVSCRVARRVWSVSSAAWVIRSGVSIMVNIIFLSNSQKLMHREIEVIFERHFILESRSIAGYVTVRENGMTKKNEIYRARFRELHYIV